MRQKYQYWAQRYRICLLFFASAATARGSMVIGFPTFAADFIGRVGARWWIAPCAPRRMGTGTCIHHLSTSMTHAMTHTHGHTTRGAGRLRLEVNGMAANTVAWMFHACTIALDINERHPRIAPTWRARVRNTLFTGFIQRPVAHLTPLRRTSEFRCTCF